MTSPPPPRKRLAVPPERTRADLWLLPGALAALGAGLVLALEVTWGVALNWDSGAYLAAARNLQAGNGFHMFNGTPYTSWPPLYPLLLAVASLDVFDPLAVAGPVNAVIFGLTIFVVAQYLRRRLESRFLVVWAGLSLALAAPLTRSASWALTEPLFILLATLALIRTDDYLTGNKTSSLAWAAVCAALAWQTRYLGAAVVAAVVLLLLCQRGARPAQRARRAAGFALAAAAPMALWLARNLLYAGSATGPRNAAPYSLPEVLSDLGRGFADWVYFDLPLVPSVEWLRLVPAAGLLAVGGAFIVIGAATRRSMPRMPFDWRPCYVFGGFALIYLMLTSAAVMLGATFHGFQPRFLTPMYVPLLVTAAFALDRLLSSVRQHSLPLLGRVPPRVAGAVVIAALCVCMVGAVEPGAREIVRDNSCDYCRGYLSHWADSETVKYVRQHPIEGVVRSNMPVVLYLHTDDATASYDYPPVWDEELQRWHRVPQDYEYVVWFDDDSRDSGYDLARLRALFGLVPVAELADGTVFVVVKDSAERRRIAAIVAGDFEAIVAGDSVRLAARSVFDLYFDDDDDTLTYFKEPCATDDVTARFFLHVVPSDPADLPDRRYAFANLDFDFGAHGTLLNGRCAAVVAFDYEISHIRTGQYLAGNHLWEVTFSP